MKRLRPQQWPSPIIRARSSGARPRQHPLPNGTRSGDRSLSLLACRPTRPKTCQQTVRHGSTLADGPPAASSVADADAADKPPLPPQPAATGYSLLYPPPPSATAQPLKGAYQPSAYLHSLPSPPPSHALSSAKLGALHARLSLPQSVPLQTLARCLVHPSADPDARFNNSLLALPGRAMLGYLVTEWLIARYPRLPMPVLSAAVRALAGRAALEDVVEKGWGVECAAEPGGEVDPGLLQFRAVAPQRDDAGAEGEREGGDVTASPSTAPKTQPETGLPKLWPPPLPAHEVVYAPARQRAYASVFHAVVGALLAHESRHAARSFVRSHVLLARHLDLSTLFHIERPTRELSLLCRREGFEPPVARLLSETGRNSRTPVFVVGVFSGTDKLGEGVASSLNDARAKAAANALRAWYLYSPGASVQVPSETWPEPGEEDWEVEKRGRAWTPLYVDIGEVVSN